MLQYPGAKDNHFRWLSSNLFISSGYVFFLLMEISTPLFVINRGCQFLGFDRNILQLNYLSVCDKDSYLFLVIVPDYDPHFFCYFKNFAFKRHGEASSRLDFLPETTWRSFCSLFVTSFSFIYLQRDGCPKIVNLGSVKTDLFYERKKYGFKKR